MLAVIRSQSGMWWESRRLLQHLRSPAAPPPHPCSPPPGLPQPSQPTRCPGDPSPRCHQGWSHPVWPGIRMGLSSPLLPSRIPPCPRPLRAQGGRDASRQHKADGVWASLRSHRNERCLTTYPCLPATRGAALTRGRTQHTRLGCPRASPWHRAPPWHQGARLERCQLQLHAGPGCPP